jgi:GT2 family glycosyltransferase
MSSTLNYRHPHEGRSPVDLGIVIVSYNVKDLLRDNLQSVFSSTGKGSIEVVVVDNASHDGSAEMVQAEFPQAFLVANKHNAGFASAVNQGIAATHARHILLLNPDMRLSGEVLAETISYADRVQKDKVAVIGARLSTQEGETLHTVRRFPDLVSQLAIIFKLPHLFPNLAALKRYHADDFDYTKEQDVDSVRGSYFVLTEKGREALGVLDSHYFIWFEEVDYCKHAVSQGWKVRYAPALQATDFVGRSFGQVTRLWAQIQFTRSMAQYFEKWHSPSEAFVIRIARLLGITVNWLVDHARRLRGKATGFRPTASS